VEKLFSTAELARMWNVSESTVKRWADSGDLTCVKTRGGHRRFTLGEISRFQRAQGFDAVGSLTPIADSEGSEERPEIERALERLDFDALAEIFRLRALAGDTDGVETVLARCYLRGIPPIDMLERILTPALHAIGELWVRGEVTVADEHLATRTTVDAVTRLHPNLIRRSPNGRAAVVGCPEGELHEVAIRCVASLLDLEGWTTVSLGMNTPFFSFSDALDRHRPDLVCVSSTHLVDLDRQAREYATFHDAARRAGVRVAIGGAGFRDSVVRSRFPHDLYAERMRDLVRFASTLV
jgi:MerR family transcriptional regulator, light-induced transcriptional regulator